MLEKGLFDWSLPRLIRPRSPDVVWTRDPVAALSCGRAGLQVVFETYRPDLALRRRFAWWRRACLAAPNLRGLITHSQLACDAFLAAGVPPDRCLVAHNGFAPSLMEPRMDRIQARTRLDLPIDVPLIVYAGHVGPEKGTEALVAMAARLPHARVVIVGIDPHSSQAGWVDQVARRSGARNLLLRPRVRLAGVAPYLYAADCLIIPPTDEPLKTYGGTVLPLKVFTYLASGRPIVAPRLPDIEEILTDGQTARLVTPDGGASAAKAVGDLLADRAAQEQLGRQALALSARYTWALRARRIAEFLHGHPDLSQVPFSAIVGSSQPS
jgi:glycosyltransferase involved in cell wall biosynthesis